MSIFNNNTIIFISYMKRTNQDREGYKQYEKLAKKYYASYVELCEDDKIPMTIDDWLTINHDSIMKKIKL